MDTPIVFYIHCTRTADGINLDIVYAQHIAGLKHIENVVKLFAVVIHHAYDRNVTFYPSPLNVLFFMRRRTTGMTAQDL